MKYQRVLGFGGFGIVQLWNIHNDDNSVDRAVAIKTVIDPKDARVTAALRREIGWAKV